LVYGDFEMMRDEIVSEEKRRRIEVEKMDTAFCAAMLGAIDAGTERSPEGIAKNRAHDGQSSFWPISSVLACAYSLS
jgi:hypothetical protein